MQLELGRPCGHPSPSLDKADWAHNDGIVWRHASIAGTQTGMGNRYNEERTLLGIYPN